MPQGVVDRFHALGGPFSHAQLLGHYRVLRDHSFLGSFSKFYRLVLEKCARAGVHTGGSGLVYRPPLYFDVLFAQSNFLMYRVFDNERTHANAPLVDLALPNAKTFLHQGDILLRWAGLISN
jgi:hypothetical protein